MKNLGVIPIFSVAFILIYAACVFFNLALFTYIPTQGKFYFLVPAVAHARGSDPMFWYGWLTTTVIGASLVTAVFALAPVSAKGKGPLTALVWVAPLVAAAVVVYALRIWFTL